MNWKYITAGLLIAVVLAVAVGVAFYTGIGPAPGGNDSSDTITDFPTATPTGHGPEDGDSASMSSSVTTATSSSTPPFTFTIDAIEDCGQTCRDVTATLHNHQNEAATGVTVYTRIFAGQNNTETDDIVWEGKESVGTLDANASHTTTRRVELSLQQALEIEQNDGWITIVTTVESDERTVTFRDSEQVA